MAALVGGHVAAKRYLLTTDPAYAALLSARSEETLGFQGGVMTPGEVDDFERRPDRADLVALRRADDAAKVRGAVVDPLAELAAERRAGRDALTGRQSSAGGVSDWACSACRARFMPRPR